MGAAVCHPFLHFGGQPDLALREVGYRFGKGWPGGQLVDALSGDAAQQHADLVGAHEAEASRGHAPDYSHITSRHTTPSIRGRPIGTQSMIFNLQRAR
jgi:hypothetical protein